MGLFSKDLKTICDEIIASVIHVLKSYYILVIELTGLPDVLYKLLWGKKTGNTVAEKN